MPDILEIATLMEDGDLRGPATIELRPLDADHEAIDGCEQSIDRLHQRISVNRAFDPTDAPLQSINYHRKTAQHLQKQLDYWQTRIGHLTAPRTMHVDIYGVTKSYRTIIVAGVHKISPVSLDSYNVNGIAVSGIVEIKRNEATQKIWNIFTSIRGMYEPWLTSKVADPDPDLDFDIFDVDRHGDTNGKARTAFYNPQFVDFVTANHPEWAEYIDNQRNYDGLAHCTITRHYEKIFYVSESNILKINDA